KRSPVSPCHRRTSSRRRKPPATTSPSCSWTASSTTSVDAMLTVPAFVWRGGFLRRALIIGGAVGVTLGALAWLDSGFWLSGVIVLVVVGLFYGIWMARRMSRYWPGAEQLSGEQRVTVVDHARRGERIGDAPLAQSVVDYAAGMRAAAEQGRPFRWV